MNVFFFTRTFRQRSPDFLRTYIRVPFFFSAAMGALKSLLIAFTYHTRRGHSLRARIQVVCTYICACEDKLYDYARNPAE